LSPSSKTKSGGFPEKKRDKEIRKLYSKLAGAVRSKRNAMEQQRTAQGNGARSKHRLAGRKILWDCISDFLANLPQLLKLCGAILDDEYR